MLYQFLRFVVFVAIRLFFKSIRLKNLKNIPSKGALILAANHPSTFLDPLVGAVFVPRQIHFLANGSIYKVPLIAWILKKLYTIPIYRQQDSANNAVQNQDSFRACYELLERKGTLIIFPEGTSEDERNLRKIKTGTARIGLGAEAKNNFELDVKIVCIGINYTNPRKFQSRLMVSFGEPIPLEKYKESYTQDSVKAVQDLTEEIRAQLASMIVVTQTKEIDDLVEKIERLYTNTLKQDLQLDTPETEQIFTVAQHFADAVHYFEAKDPARVDKLQSHINQYFDLLKKHHLSDSLMTQGKHSFFDKFKGVLFAILGFPLYLFGLIHNFLPYELPAVFTNAITKDITYHAPMNITFGIFTFLGFYLGYAFGFHYFIPHWGHTFLYLLALALSGFFTYKYWYFLLYLIGHWRATNYMQNSNFQVLLTSRKQIIEELEQAKKEYLESLD
jgi:glycerol-3-phosphate O-acyltransferase / dihydroxyacetone phosphate acyltransferase